MQRTDARIAQIGEDQPTGDTRRDHLVVEQIGRHTDEGQLAAALADDFVAGGKADEGSETFNGYTVAVADISGDGVAHREKFVGHRGWLNS